jgi:hypothetical protein
MESRTDFSALAVRGVRLSDTSVTYIRKTGLISPLIRIEKYTKRGAEVAATALFGENGLSVREDSTAK